jgi:hypothetical protein
MRVVKEISHPDCKITVFAWNNRYLIKFEAGLMEQTFKIDQTDVTGEEELIRILDAEFVQQTLTRFGNMAHSLNNARQRADS